MKYKLIFMLGDDDKPTAQVYIELGAPNPELNAMIKAKEGKWKVYPAVINENLQTVPPPSPIDESQCQS